MQETHAGPENIQAHVRGAVLFSRVRDMNYTQRFQSACITQIV